MDAWHRDFERFAPEWDQDFLEALGLAPRYGAGCAPVVCPAVSFAGIFLRASHA